VQGGDNLAACVEKRDIDGEAHEEHVNRPAWAEVQALARTELGASDEADSPLKEGPGALHVLAQHGPARSIVDDEGHSEDYTSECGPSRGPA
jgi:hypothetical protein